MKKSHVYIIGTGIEPDDMSVRALRLIAGADVLAGGQRLLDWFADASAEKIVFTRSVDTQVQTLKRRLPGRTIAVLASGDPNFFGIAAVFYRHYRSDQLTVIPNVTALQWACARTQHSWQDMRVVSVHGRSLHGLDAVAGQSGLFAVYCDSEHSPPVVARYLLEHCTAGQDCTVHVCSDMGAAAENVSTTTLKRLARRTVGSGLSVMIVALEPRLARPALGLPDSLFARERGMITRRDVRLIALARLELQGTGVLWDIGAATGSVAIEAANLYPALRVIAVEQNARRFADLRANISRLCTGRVEPLKGVAPAVLRGLAAPDRVFIGGGGDSLSAILRVVKRRLRPAGVVALNCVSPDSLSTALRIFQGWGWRYCVTTVQFSHLDSAQEPEIFRAENPVWVVQARASGSD